MDKTLYSLLLVLIMSFVTYAIRVAPFLFFKKKIKSRFIKSFLYYVPYAVLVAMTFPSIFYITGNVISSAVGTVVAILASLSKKSMMVVVAILAVVAVLACEGIMYLI